MSLVNFIRRNELPEILEIGTFYWIDKQDETSEIWFGSKNGKLRLDNKLDKSELDEIISRLSGVESDIESIQDILQGIQETFEGIDFDEYLTASDLDDYVTRDELREQVEEAMSGYSPDLGDSDWDIIEEKISEKVNEKTFDLTWKEI